jgi:hypothetical protein
MVYSSLQKKKEHSSVRSVQNEVSSRIYLMFFSEQKSQFHTNNFAADIENIENIDITGIFFPISIFDIFSISQQPSYCNPFLSGGIKCILVAATLQNSVVKPA